MFNSYQESMRVPLVFSNPRLWPAPLKSSALVSHVDAVPTLAALLGAPPGLAAAAGWQGVSYANTVINPAAYPHVQEEILWLFYDFQYGQSAWPGTPTEPFLIHTVVEDRFTYSEVWDPTGRTAAEYEMYDRLTDPQETDNLAWPGRAASLTPEQAAQKDRLAAKLAQAVATKLTPRLGYKWHLNMTSSAMATLATGGGGGVNTCPGRRVGR